MLYILFSDSTFFKNWSNINSFFTSLYNMKIRYRCNTDICILSRGRSNVMLTFAITVAHFSVNGDQLSNHRILSQIEIMCKSYTYLKCTHDYSCNYLYELIILHPILHEIYLTYWWIPWRWQTFPMPLGICSVENCAISQMHFHLNSILLCRPTDSFDLSSVTFKAGFCLFTIFAKS